MQGTGNNPAQDKDLNHSFYFVLRIGEDFLGHIKYDRMEDLAMSSDSEFCLE